MTKYSRVKEEDNSWKLHTGKEHLKIKFSHKMPSILYIMTTWPIKKIDNSNYLLSERQKKKKPSFLFPFPFLFNNVENVNNSSDGKDRKDACVYLTPPIQCDGEENLPSCWWPRHWREILLSHPSSIKKLPWSFRHDVMKVLIFSCHCSLLFVCNFSKSITLHWEYIWISAQQFKQINF